jgi:serine phosphatase RsbU (regulator of sigma subunit)
MASLLVLKGIEPNKRLKIDAELVVLGRNPDCQIVIPNHAVSRQHAQISRVQGKFFIEDLESRNRTYVNNQEVTGRTLLKDNDRIKICDFLFRFDLDMPAPPKPLPPEMRPVVEEEDDTATHQPTIEAQLRPNQHLLEAQPSDRLRALLEISGALNKSLDSEGLLPKIADTLFDLFRQADRCFVILREGQAGRLNPKVVKTRRNVGDTGADFSKTIVRKCLEMNEAFLSEDASADAKFSLAQSIAEFRIRSVMCVPLADGEGKAAGVIQLDCQDRGKKFTKDDLGFLTAVANIASAALENVKLHEDQRESEHRQREIELAQRVQRGFLPERSPQLKGYEFFAFYQAALTVGGDYYDFIPLPGNRLGVLLGDVAGKGIPAALLMAKLSAEARYCMLTAPDVGVACRLLNNALQVVLQERFVTLAALVLDPAAHTLTIVNAGHMPPMLYRRTTGDFLDAIDGEVTGLPLGVLEDNEYQTATLNLQPGDSVLLYTDGVTDSLSTANQPFGVPGIRRAVEGEETGLPLSVFTAPQLGARIIEAVKQHALGQSQNDDIALVCFGREDGTGGAPTLSPATPMPSFAPQTGPLVRRPGSP